MGSVKSLESCFKERNVRETGNFVDTVEDRIEKAILIASDSFLLLKSSLHLSQGTRPLEKKRPMSL